MTNHQKIVLALAVLWVAVQATMFGLFGIGRGGDTGRYLGAADTILSGQLPAGKSASYFGYDLFVTLFMATPAGEAGVIAGQLFLSAAAAVYMYKLGLLLFSKNAGFCAAFFYIGFLKLHPWNVYILTDSLFISLIVISTYFLLTAQTRWQISGAVLLVLYTTTVRPDGVALLAAATLYGLYRLYRAKKYAAFTGAIIFLLLCAPFVWQGLTKVAADEELLHHYRLGAVIWSYEPLYQGDATSSPSRFIKLAATKVWYELAHVRLFHDPIHNFLIIVTLVPLYILAIFGVRNLRRDAKVFILSLITIKMAIVAFTFADWSGRFLLHVMPLILLPAAGGFLVLMPEGIIKKYGLL